MASRAQRINQINAIDTESTMIATRVVVENKRAQRPLLIVNDAKAMSRSVRFSKVEVNSFPCVPGDNPSVRDGAPIALAPTHISKAVVGVDDFETERENGRRVSRELMIDRNERERRYVVPLSAAAVVDRLPYGADRLVFPSKIILLQWLFLPMICS